MDLNQVVLPAEHEAEAMILGAAMTHPDDAEILFNRVSSEMFDDSWLRNIYLASFALFQKNISLTQDSISKKLQQLGDINAWGGLTTLSNCVLLGRACDIEHYIKKVEDAYRKRELLKLGDTIIQRCKLKDFNATKTMEDVEQKLLALRTRETTQRTKTGEELFNEIVPGKSYPEWLASQRAKRLSHKSVLEGPSTGFYHLDDVLGGFVPSRFIVVGARAAVGKTEFICQLVAKLIANSISCSVFTLEMSKEEYFKRLMGILLGKNHSSIAKGDLTDVFEADLPKKLDLCEPYLKFVSITDLAGINSSDLNALTRKEIAKHSSQVVFVDHLGLLRPQSFKMSRYEAVSYNSNAMKTIAMEHKVCVVSAVQLNRGLEKRQDATPQLSDLRDSGDIEQDADQVILLHRNDEKKLFFVEVKKNRHDRTVDIVFDYEPETQYLEEHQWNV